MRAVIFDLYETLITEFDPAWTPGPSLAMRLGLEEEAFAAAWKERWRRRMTGELADFPDTVWEICQALGQKPTEALLAQLHQERLMDKARPFAHLDASIVQMLDDLRTAHMRIGLLSNASREEAVAWFDSKLADLFDDALFSYQVGRIKPEPEIYALACRRLGVAPQECLFVGDGGHHELSGAAAAGLTPYWATWFLDRWSVAKARPGAIHFPRLCTPAEVAKLIDPCPTYRTVGQ